MPYAQLGGHRASERRGIGLALGAAGTTHAEKHMQRLLAAALLLFVVSGCVIVGDPTCSDGGASIVVAPGIVVVSVGESFTPNGRDSWCDGGHQSYGSPNWSLSQASDADVIALDAATGRITGRRSGTATVVARSAHSDATSTIVVTVR